MVARGTRDQVAATRSRVCSCDTHSDRGDMHSDAIHPGAVRRVSSECMKARRQVRECGVQHAMVVVRRVWSGGGYVVRSVTHRLMSWEEKHVRRRTAHFFHH